MLLSKSQWPVSLWSKPSRKYKGGKQKQISTKQSGTFLGSVGMCRNTNFAYMKTPFFKSHDPEFKGVYIHVLHKTEKITEWKRSG